MSRYSDLVREFLDDYEQPEVGEYIVGFSGLDPDRKVKEHLIDHERLGGLLGGDAAGRYHLTSEQLQQFRTYLRELEGLKAQVREKTAEIEAAFRECEDTLTGRVDVIASSQGELRGSQERLSVRYDALVGSVTEDTEILDARIDAEDEIHPNLGANVRSIHAKGLKEEDARHEIDAILYGAIAEEAGNLGNTLLEAVQKGYKDKAEVMECLRSEEVSRKSSDEALARKATENEQGLSQVNDRVDSEVFERKADIEGLRATDGELKGSLEAGLSQQAELSRRGYEENAERLDTGEALILDLLLEGYFSERARKSETAGILGRLSEAIERMEEEASEVSSAVQMHTLRVPEYLRGIYGRLEREAGSRQEDSGALREADGELSSGLLEVIRMLREKFRRLDGRLEHEQDSDAVFREHIGEEQVNVALSNIEIMRVLSSIIQSHKQEKGHNDSIIQLIYEKLSEDIGFNAEGILKITAGNKSYRDGMRAFMSRMTEEVQRGQEGVTDASIGVMYMAGSVNAAISRMREEYRHFMEEMETARLSIQEQVDEVATAVMTSSAGSHAIRIMERQRQEHEAEETAKYREYLQEQVNDDVAGSLSLSSLVRTESVRLRERLSQLEEDMSATGLMTYKGAGVAGRDEVNDMMEDVFSGDGTGGTEGMGIPEELSGEVSGSEEFDDMLEEIFG